MFHFTSETRHRGKQRKDPVSPRGRKLKACQSTGKLTASLFWDKEGFIHVEFMPRSTTINANPLLRCAATTVWCYLQKEPWPSVAKCDPSA